MQGTNRYAIFNISAFVLGYFRSGHHTWGCTAWDVLWLAYRFPANGNAEQARRTRPRTQSSAAWCWAAGICDKLCSYFWGVYAIPRYRLLEVRWQAGSFILALLLQAKMDRRKAQERAMLKSIHEMRAEKALRRKREEEEDERSGRERGEGKICDKFSIVSFCFIFWLVFVKSYLVNMADCLIYNLPSTHSDPL